MREPLKLFLEKISWSMLSFPVEGLLKNNYVFAVSGSGLKTDRKAKAGSLNLKSAMNGCSKPEEMAIFPMFSKRS